MTHSTPAPTVSPPAWVQQLKAEDEYFARQEKQRGLWFDFYCINPFNKPITTHATKPNNNRTMDAAVSILS